MNRVAEYFKTERKKLVNYVRSRIDDAADRDAEDVVQDVMLNLFDKADISVPVENLQIIFTTGFIQDGIIGETEKMWTAGKTSGSSGKMKAKPDTRNMFKKNKKKKKTKAVDNPN